MNALAALAIAAAAPAFGRIDAHAHVFSSPPAFLEMLERLDVRLVSITVVDKHDRGYEEAEPQHQKAAEVARASRGRVVWSSTFDPQDWESPGFAERAIALLEKTFEDGSVAVKIYKSIGMELKSRSGRYLMPDDPVFEPILAAVASRNRTTRTWRSPRRPGARWTRPAPTTATTRTIRIGTCTCTRSARPRKPFSPPVIVCWNATRTCAWSDATSEAWKTTSTRSRSAWTGTRTSRWTPRPGFRT